MKNIAFLLLLISCHKPTSYSIQKVESQNARYSSLKISKEDSPYREAEFVIALFSDQIKCYLDFFRQTLVTNTDAVIRIEIEKEELEKAGYIHKGGQRLLLEQTLVDKIIKALLEGKDVHILHEKCEILLQSTEISKILQKYHLK